jgi:hypothetical protein
MVALYLLSEHLNRDPIYGGFYDEKQDVTPIYTAH